MSRIGALCSAPTSSYVCLPIRRRRLALAGFTRKPAKRINPRNPVNPVSLGFASIPTRRDAPQALGSSSPTPDAPVSPAPYALGLSPTPHPMSYIPHLIHLAFAFLPLRLAPIPCSSFTLIFKPTPPIVKLPMEPHGQPRGTT